MHVLQDILAPGLRIIFCGSAVGSASARRGAYYAGPGNAFWPTLYEVGLTPRLLAPEEYKSITRYGLGLTDLAKTVAGSDAALSDRDFDRGGLRVKIEQCAPGFLAFTGKRAAQAFVGTAVGYGPLQQRIGNTVLFVLPSPSGAARRYWSTRPWHDLAALAQARNAA